MVKEEHIFIDIYLKYFKRYMKKNHMKISAEQHEWIITQIEHISSWGVDVEDWEEQVIDHFNHLSSKNDGNIIPSCMLRIEGSM